MTWVRSDLNYFHTMVHDFPAAYVSIKRGLFTVHFTDVIQCHPFKIQVICFAA